MPVQICQTGFVVTVFCRMVISEVTTENVHADRKIPEHSLHSSSNRISQRPLGTFEVGTDNRFFFLSKYERHFMLQKVLNIVSLTFLWGLLLWTLDFVQPPSAQSLWNCPSCCLLPKQKMSSLSLKACLVNICRSQYFCNTLSLDQIQVEYGTRKLIFYFGYIYWTWKNKASFLPVEN